MPSPKLVPLVLTDDERRTLTGWVRRRKTAQALSARAQNVLACAEGGSIASVAAELGVSRNMVSKWRSRFLRDRLEGLSDEPRPGRPRTVTDEQVELVITRTLEEPGPGQDTHWSTRSMAAATGRMLPADSQTRAPRWTEQAFLFPGYRTAELGYAVTEHVAQGRTVAATRTVVTPSDDRQGTYVGVSRATGDNVIMVITPSPKLADPQPLTRPAPELARSRQLEQERQGRAPRRSPRGDLDEGMAVLADVLAGDATDLAATE